MGSSKKGANFGRTGAVFSLGAIALVIFIAWYSNRGNNNERSTYETHRDDQNFWLLLHIRQDIKLVAAMLGGVIVMLGIVADRIR